MSHFEQYETSTVSGNLTALVAFMVILSNHESKVGRIENPGFIAQWLWGAGPQMNRSVAAFVMAAGLLLFIGVIIFGPSDYRDKAWMGFTMLVSAAAGFLFASKSGSA